eukprot:g17672.t1
MGDVPINPSGFAHGFRPLDGAGNPPPTPTQRNITQREEVVPGGGVLSVLTQQTLADSDAMGIGLGSSRKRRRLPGPLAFLQQGHSGAGQQENGGGSDEGIYHQLSDDSDGDEGEAGGGHFRKGPWLSLCSALDAPIPEESASDSEAVQTFFRSAVSPMSEVLSGDFDLRVPVVTAVIDSYAQLSVSDVVVELVDPSGRIKGYLHPGCLEEHGPLLGPGAALLLKEVSIFVSGPGTTRLLNVHPDCVLAVFPVDTPLPTPSRLEWLTTCEAPFMLRSVSDAGDHGLAPPLPSRRTPQPPTTPAGSSVASQGGATSRRRPHPLAARDDPEQSSSQRHPRPQRAATRRIPPPAPRLLDPLRDGRQLHHEKQSQERSEHGRRQRRPRQTQATPDGGEPSMGETRPRTTPPRRTLPDVQPLALSHLPSSSPGCQSPTEMFSLSQTQRQHDHTPLGQHSDDDGGGGGDGGWRLGEGDAPVEGTGDCGTSGRRREDGDIRARGREEASIAVEREGGESLGEVNREDTSSTGSGSGGHGGVSAILGNTSTQQDASAGMLGSASKGGGDDGANADGSLGEKEAVMPTVPLGDKCNATVTAVPSQGVVAAGPAGKASRTGLCSGDVSGLPAHRRVSAQPTPGNDAEQPGPTAADERGRKGGVGGASPGARGARVDAPSSIWVDLDGLASGDDSTSDDGEGATRSHLAAAQPSEVPSLLQDPASSNTSVLVGAAVGKSNQGATVVAGETTSDVAEHDDMGLASAGDLHAAGKAGRGAVASGSAGFSLLAGAGGSFGDDELLDAALEDSD